MSSFIRLTPELSPPPAGLPRLQTSPAPADSAQPSSGRSSFAYAVTQVGVFAACYGAGLLVPIVPFENSAAPPLWPATGCALAALLLFGFRFWPSIFAADFFLPSGGGASSS